MNRLVEKIYAYEVGLKPNTKPLVLSDIVTKVVSVLGYIAGTLALIYLIWSGIMYITANGNPEQAKKAQTGIINSIIGIIVIVLAYGIFTAIVSFSGGTAGGVPTI